MLPTETRDWLFASAKRAGKTVSWFLCEILEKVRSRAD
jgi:predicted DNA-binding protein